MLVLKRIYAYLFLLFFCWQFIGFVGYIQLSKLAIRKEIKHRIKAGVPESELIVLNFSKSECAHLVWHKKNEFAYNGHLYDIISKRSTADEVEFKCIDDRKEAKLFKDLDHFVAKRFQKGEKGSKVISWLETFKCLSSVKSTQEYLLFTDERNHIFSYSKLLVTRFIKRDPMPPKVFC
jgi:hypothetical protein